MTSAGEDPLLECAGLSQAELAELLAMVAGTDITELELGFEGSRLTLGRAARPASAAGPTQAAAAPAEEAASVAVVSPLVGIFHPSVQPGQAVTAGQVIGAIEALGMPTSVDAPQAGTVEDVLVHEGSPVEYGQPLLVLRRLARA